jgi:hypothetical protein
MCSCDDFYASIIDARSAKRSQFSAATPVLLRSALTFSGPDGWESQKCVKKFLGREKFADHASSREKFLSDALW